MSVPEEDKITFYMKLLTLLIGIIISLFGWTINSTLMSINENIKDLKSEIKLLSVGLYDHESRIKVIEEKIKDK